MEIFVEIFPRKYPRRTLNRAVPRDRMEISPYEYFHFWSGGRRTPEIFIFSGVQFLDCPSSVTAAPAQRAERELAMSAVWWAKMTAVCLSLTIVLSY